MIWQLLWILLALGGALAVHAVFFAPYDLATTELEVEVEGLHPDLHGYTIAVLSDLHVHAGSRRRYLRRAVAAANAARPDLAALLGDYAVSFEDWRAPNALLYRRGLLGVGDVLRQIDARDGIVAVLGNHDHFAGPEWVRRWLEEHGIRVLVNDCVVITRGAGRLAIGGVDDEGYGRVDPHGGCGDLPGNLPRVILSHSPDAVLHFDASARADLILAGHTHGGQIVFPVIGALLTMSRVCTRGTPSGWIDLQRLRGEARGWRLYVTRGIGAMIPIRFGCPPELVIVRVVSPARGAAGLQQESAHQLSADR